MTRPKSAGVQISLSEALRQLDLRLDSAHVRREAITLSANGFASTFLSGSN
jgi:hypothetical protein